MSGKRDVSSTQGDVGDGILGDSGEFCIFTSAEWCKLYNKIIKV